MQLFKTLTISIFSLAALPVCSSPLSLSSGSNPFIPTDVIEQFSLANPEQKAKFCVGDLTPVFEELREVTEQPPKKVQGYNSRMDNRDNVVGAAELDIFVLRMSEALTSSWVKSDESSKNELLDLLHNWAKTDALLETQNCMVGGRYSNSCTSWTQKDGQDPSKAMDYNSTQINVMHLAYGYYSLLSDFNPTDPRHEIVQGWFARFFERNKEPFLGFGLDYGFLWPKVVSDAIQASSPMDRNSSVKLLQNAVDKLDSLIASDGSFADRTTRGNRALWYHLTGLNETLITLEMARAAGIQISDDLDARIINAADIFIKGYQDHSYMDKWAKVAHRSIYVPGEQKFYSTFDTPNGNAGMYIFIYRYSDSEPAKKIADLLGRTPSAGRMDSYIGFGMGCIYAAAKESRDGPWGQNLLVKFGDRVLMSLPEEVKPLQIKGAYPTGTHSELNYKDFKYTIVGAVIDGTTISLPIMRFNLMFDFAPDSKSKPILVRIELEADQLPEIMQSDSMDNCNKNTFTKDVMGVSKIRLALGEHADFKNECMLSSLSSNNRMLLLGLAQKLENIISTSKKSELSQQADSLLAAYLMK